jgi:HSP20 family molecular chaperone IbpA
MWAQALELVAQAERMQRQFFHLAVTERAQAVWEPPVDVFEDEHEIVIVVALPGVPAERVEVASEPGVLVIRAESPFRFAASRRTVRQLEIPYGCFERRISLPRVRLEAGTHELKDGCLVLKLRKTD